MGNIEKEKIDKEFEANLYGGLAKKDKREIKIPKSRNIKKTPSKVELFLITRSYKPEDLREWVDYHLAIGFDLITILDNRSYFSVKKLFEDYKNVDVRILNIKWKNFVYMADIYNQFCFEKKGKTDWLALIDDDEYIYLKNEKNIKNVLNYEYKVLSFYWKYISSKDLMKSREKTVIDTFHYARDSKKGAYPVWVKSIVNLNRYNAVRWKTPHTPIFRLGETLPRTVDGTIVNFEHTPPISDDFYDNQTGILYHYFEQSEEDWVYKIKDRPNFKLEDFGKNHSYNIEDYSMINRKKELGI